MTDADAEGGSLGEQSTVGVGVGIDGDPELAGTEVAQDSGHSAHVIGVGVCEGDDIEAAELSRPEVGRDDLFADVEGGGGKDGVLGVGGGPGGATGVDEHGAASGADNQQRVALADIDGGDFELVGMDGWRHVARGRLQRREGGR